MNSNGSRLNKEKLCLFAAMIPASIAVYSFVISAPASLKVPPPLTNQSGPEIKAVAAITTAPEMEYFRGTRRTPFKPINFSRSRDNGGKGGEPPKPPEPGFVEGGKNGREFPAINPASAYDFMGVVVFDGSRYGMIRPKKDGLKPQRVQRGDSIAGGQYTVTRVEPQAIFLKDRDGNQFELKDWQTKQVHVYQSMNAGDGAR